MEMPPPAERWSLEPSLAHLHAVLGSNEMEFDWDSAGGEEVRAAD